MIFIAFSDNISEPFWLIILFISFIYFISKSAGINALILRRYSVQYRSPGRRRRVERSAASNVASDIDNKEDDGTEYNCREVIDAGDARRAQDDYERRHQHAERSRRPIRHITLHLKPRCPSRVPLSQDIL